MRSSRSPILGINTVHEFELLVLLVDSAIVVGGGGKSRLYFDNRKSVSGFYTPTGMG